MPVLEHRRVDREAQQTIAVEIHRHALTRSQVHSPCGGDDHALVGNTLADERDISGIRLDVALVDDTPRGARTRLERVIAAHELVDADAHGSGDEAADVDLRTGLEEYPVGVHQDDLAIGLDPPEDLARLVIENPVQGRRTRVRLPEAHRLVRGDVERTPIQGGALAALTDGGDARVWVTLASPARTVPPWAA